MAAYNALLDVLPSAQNLRHREAGASRMNVVGDVIESA
jgi:hypothetical protein